MLAIATTLLVFLVTLVLALSWQKRRYWKGKGVPSPPSLPILGHIHLLFRGARWENIDKMYQEHKANGCWGVYEFLEPSLHVSDPDILRAVFVKDANHFMDRRRIKFSKSEDLLNEMLSIINGEEWKALRTLLSPTFSSGKIKSMFPLVREKSIELANQCEQTMAQNSFVQMQDLAGYYTMDVIATCAFGIDAQCLQRKQSSEFITVGTEFMNMSYDKLIKVAILTASPRLYNALGLQVHEKPLKFFSNIIEETISLRKKSGIKRGDFLDYMLETLEEFTNKKRDINYPMTINTIIAESVLFLLAGYDTTSNSISIMAYLLAKYPDIQKRLRDELTQMVDLHGEINYHAIMEAQYLDAAVAECLRLYPPAYFIERRCSTTCRIPDANLNVPEGMMIGIPVWSLHRDPEYWPEPLQFKPERFLPENKGDIKPYTYMPFGHGPRNCIALRFAQLEMKIAIAELCLQFEMELRPGYHEMTLLHTLSTLRPDKEGVQLVMKKRNNATVAETLSTS